MQIEVSLNTEKDVLAEAERKIIEKVLELNCGNKRLSATVLGITIKTLRNKINMFPELRQLYRTEHSTISDLDIKEIKDSFLIHGMNPIVLSINSGYTLSAVENLLIETVGLSEFKRIKKMNRQHGTKTYKRRMKEKENVLYQN